MSKDLLSIGTIQSDRLENTLLPESITIDGKTLPDFLNFIRKFSEIVQFWDLSNHPIDNWSTFFDQDILFALAHILEIDIDHLSEQQIETKSRFDQVPSDYLKEEALVNYLLIIFELAEIIHHWLSQLENQIIYGDYPVIKSELTENIKSNVSPETLLLDICVNSMWKTFTQNPNTYAQKNLFHPAIKYTKIFSHLLLPKGTMPSETLNESLLFSTYLDFLSYFDLLFHSLFATIHQVQDQIESNYLNTALTRANHSPHISLIFALWETMKKTKG